MKFMSCRTFAAAWLGAPLAAALFPLGAAAAGASPTADEIMVKVDHATRRAYSTQLAIVRITTCKYRLVEGAVKCSEKPRVVIADNIKKGEVIDGLYSDKSLLIVREPASDKGTSLLVWEYGEKNRDNDNWIYLPALGKVNRVVSTDEDGGSVFGSELSVETVENPEARKLHEYTYKVLEDGTYDGRKAWQVELLPTAEKARKTSYTKVVSWIDKQTFLPLKEDMYRDGKVHKQRFQSAIRQIDGVNVTTKVVVNNRTDARVSQMDYMGMRHNTDVPDEFLGQRALTDFAYRERNLATFRERLNAGAAANGIAAANGPAAP